MEEQIETYQTWEMNNLMSPLQTMLGCGLEGFVTGDDCESVDAPRRKVGYGGGKS